MKKVQIFLLAMLVAFASCRDKNGKLPNASITGETPWDLVPWWMMAIGVILFVIAVIYTLVNKEGIIDKLKNPASVWFWCGWLGVVLFVMGLVIKS